MAIGTLNFEKVLALPSTYTPNTIYLVKDPNSTEYISFYISGQDGNSIFKLPDTNTINQLFYNSFNSQFLIIADLSSLYNTQMTEGLVGMAWVLDTEGDPSTNGLPAPYIYVPNGASGNWYGLFNINYLQNNIQWSWLQNGPQSTPQEIDAMVAWWKSNSTALAEIEDGWNEVSTLCEESALFIYNNGELIADMENYFFGYDYVTNIYYPSVYYPSVYYPSVY